MAKMTKTTKKVTAPEVAEEEVTPEVEETTEEVIEETRMDEIMESEVTEDTKPNKKGKLSGTGNTDPILSLNDQFMAQVDRALENAYKLYEQKYLTREVIQSICNSVLK